MTSSLLPAALAVGSGGVVGLVLGLIGGGGSILAVPLIVYLVGGVSPHVAIGTAAMAVALNAAFSLLAHARQGTVKWRCATVFAAAGVAGAALGAEAGKALDGQRLLALFGLIMIVVGVAMLRRGEEVGDPGVRLSSETAPELLPRLLGIGFGVGLLAGFFGIGGGFLIVPGLLLATGMPIRNAVGTSLVAVTAFGLTTAASYAHAGFIDWPLAATFIAGGFAGSLAGVHVSKLLAERKNILSRVFAAAVIVIGTAVTLTSLRSFAGS